MKKQAEKQSETHVEKIKEVDKYLEKGLIAIFHAENQIYKGLKTMADESASNELSEIFQAHREETEKQIERLKKISNLLEIDLENSHNEEKEKEGIVDKGKNMVKHMLHIDANAVNETMEWLISKGKKTLGYLSDRENTGDLAIAAGAQLIEGFEILSYKALCALAKKQGHRDVFNLLKESLAEEKEALGKVQKYFDKDLQKLTD